MKLTTCSDVDVTLLERLELRLLLSAGSLADEIFAAADLAETAVFAPTGETEVMGKPADGTKRGKGGSTDDIGNTFAEATALLLDGLGWGLVSGKVDYAGDVDVLSMVATQTGRMQVDLNPLANRKNKVSGDLSAYDGAAVLLGRDADGADIQASLSFDVVSGETYYIKVASLDGLKGKYNIAVSTTAATDPDPGPDPAPDPDPDPAPEPDPDPAPEPEPDPAPDPAPDPSPPGEYVPGSEVAWYTEDLSEGVGLVVLGTDGADQITVSHSGGSTIVITAGGTYILADTFISIQLYGFGGDDLLVSISGVSETVWGGDGFDSFWVDSLDVIGDVDASETAAKSVHVVSEFYQPTSDPGEYVSLELGGQDIVDPIVSVPYADFSDVPLFVDGAQYDDIIQNGIGDCYLMATLSSLAYSDPMIVEQMIVSLGDGTFAVRFYRDGQPVYVRIDGELPSYEGSPKPATAQFSADGESWVAFVEKAYAQFRLNENSYGSLNGGWMDGVYTQITNMAAGGPLTSTLSSDALAQYIAENLDDGHAVSAGTGSGVEAPLIGSHAYVVTSIENVDGEWYVTVFNVWGRDGKDWDDNYFDGLVTISLTMFQDNFFRLSVSSA